MSTPIYDFLKAYQRSGVSRLHMPGHKGVPRLGPEGLDITEIRGADELYEASGIIAESEANATRLFGTGCTLYSTEGSSHAIRSMILLAAQKYAGHGRTILAARNAHKAFLYALALADCDARWVYPAGDAENSAAACGMTPEALETALREADREGNPPFAAYVTSPDYLGRRADIAGLSAVCRAHGLPLLVDGAHGAYLHFLPERQHPMDLGAAMCCDSAHKTLPVLTGGAYLHLAQGVASIPEAKAAMEMTGTTSPSYLIMASLDLANGLLMGDYPARFAELADRLDAWKAARRAEGIPLLQGERLKVAADAGAMGFTGGELGDVLRACGGEPEFCDVRYLVCMLTPENTPEDLDRLAEALRRAAGEKRPARPGMSLHLRPLERRMSIREAVLAPHEILPLDRAEGRICGAPTVSCPPAIPLAVSGEILDRRVLDLMAAYGITEVSTVRE